ncbi:hypothetical protein EQM14_04390 [Caproiciproducens sp. NJN-50]|uniref:hypothetical protein n=1 Tax=Acutalibacteraceae TaxID=3082771 RepID=UPI000FFDF89B|nr:MULTISPECIES: hypothetical protein [Acutalibacteraceae]QAT49072.1 hypothetical protein EQM14_04390 [Caproiciproducens sp. NJN-50]
MSLFNLFWNLSLGIVGGIVSSVVVSRVFLIQSNYKSQVTQFEKLLRKLGYIDGMFFGIKTVLEFSYDADTKMEQEMKRCGYKTEDEYYAAHKECRWISKEDLLKNLLSEIQKMANTTDKELMNNQITEDGLRKITNHLSDYVRDVAKLKECSFTSIHELEAKSESIQKEFENYKKDSTKLLLKMILKDKLMIILYIFMALIFLSAILAYHYGV